MTTYVFDIETDGLLDEVSEIHCIVMADMTTRKLKKFTSASNSIEEGLQLLSEATQIIGHNIMEYDLGVIKKLYPTWHTSAVITDTLICSRLMWGNMYEVDATHYKFLPTQFKGRHSLGAWGYRLGALKGDFGTTADWSVFTPEMLTYCVQDVKVNVKFYEHVLNQKYSKDAIDLEHAIHGICLEQQAIGFPFNEEKAAMLYAELGGRRDEIKQHMVDTFEPNIIELKTKTKIIPFNPSSRQQIADRLQKRGWVPTEFTEAGQVVVNETTLKVIEDSIPEAKLLLEYLMLIKRLGQLSEGKNGWLKLSKNGRIHSRTNTLGAVTGRSTSSNPNIQQVPSERAVYGKECRELFHAPKGWELMGSDQSGIELRALAHYMSEWDKGDYGKVILNGDIHTANQEAAGLETRSQAKTFIYGWLYGAGSAKIGSIVGKGSKEGTRLKNQFLDGLPALKKLQERVQDQAKKGKIRALDNRYIPVRHQHASLNSLLQSCAAILAKRWVVIFHSICKAHGYLHGKDYQQVAWVHDEIQVLVKEGTGDEFGKYAQDAMRQTGEYYSFGIRLDADYNIGKSWAETH
tara:strand:- start:364 stop:2088 length:1725 start_codon:yes stop_codon:yes gene_type:complete